MSTHPPEPQPAVSPGVEKLATIAYKPFGMVFSVLGGILANVVFGQVWKRISDAPTPPNATDEDYTTREVLLAAVLQGALFGLIKSAVDRAGMRGVQRVLAGGRR
ncbi:DUF4235 domain-containing protein [Pseudonocardia sp. GCM10023141]|uniref:DUF4235 domain-containing protein n=1 Tax=Pseudonocardia sp. GCM10023141 TaxID=3252653 RepID=UPI0036210673